MVYRLGLAVTYLHAMAGIDLTFAQAQLAAYQAAETAVLKGQAYQMGQRSMRLPDLKEIRDGISYWDGMVQRLSSTNGRRGIRMRGATIQG